MTFLNIKLLEAPVKEWFIYSWLGQEYKVRARNLWPLISITKGIDGYFVRIHRWYIQYHR